MTKSVRVNIAGTEYGLKSDDEQILLMAAAELNKQIEVLSGMNKNEQVATVTMLAGLNVAEKYYENVKQQISDRDYVISEVDSMSSYIKDILTSLV